MELLILILAFITIPFIIYQSVIIERLQEDIKTYDEMPNIKDNIINKLLESNTRLLKDNKK